METMIMKKMRFQKFILKASIVYFISMFVLTLLSRQIQYWNLPTVAVTKTVAGVIKKDIQAQGILNYTTSTNSYDVTFLLLEQDAIYYKTGQTVDLYTQQNNKVRGVLESLQHIDSETTSLFVCIQKEDQNILTQDNAETVTLSSTIELGTSFSILDNRYIYEEDNDFYVLTLKEKEGLFDTELFVEKTYVKLGKVGTKNSELLNWAYKDQLIITASSQSIQNGDKVLISN